MGAGEAVLLCDKSFAGADTFATACTLVTAITKFPFELILCGNETMIRDFAKKVIEPMVLLPITLL